MAISSEAWAQISDMLGTAADILSDKSDPKLDEAMELMEKDGDEHMALSYAALVYSRALYYSENDGVKEVNSVSHYGNMFTIDNYSYNMYKWACSNGFSEYAAPLRIFLPEKILNEAQHKQLLSKV